MKKYWLFKRHTVHFPLKQAHLSNCFWYDEMVSQYNDDKNN